MAFAPLPRVALVASLVACAGPSTTPPRAAPAVPAATAATAASYELVPFGENQVRAPRVTLLEPGTGPRAPLTWAARSPFLLKMSIRHDTLAVGAKEHEDLVAVELTVGVEAKEAAPGLTSVFAMIQSAELPAGHKAGAETGKYTSLVGHGVVWTVTPRGQVVGHGTVVVSGRNDLTYGLAVFGRTLSPVLFAPLPSEPIGIGARWRVRAPVFAMNQMQLEETEYTLQARQPLQARDGRVLGISARVSRIALVDGSGVILTDDDVDRVWAAVEGQAQQPFDRLAARIRPVTVGERSLLFPDIEAMYGEYEWLTRTDFEGSVVSETGTDAVHGELRDSFHVRRADAPVTREVVRGARSPRP